MGPPSLIERTARALACALAGVALVASAACTSPGGGVLIGAAGNWDAGYGVMNQRGIELALDEINRDGGVDGRPLQLLMRNDKGEAARAVTIAAEFVAQPRVLAVVGHVNSGTMLAAARVYDEGLPAVSTTASSSELTGTSPWVFRVISSDSVNGSDLAAYARAQGFARAAVLYENNAYGRGLAESFERNFGGTIVGTDPIPAHEEADLEPFIAWIAARRPDLVFVAGTEASGLGVLREARRQRLAATFMGSDGWSGIVADTSLSEGVLVGTPFTPADPRAEVQRFVRAFRERYGVAPDGNAALAYDATHLVARAVREGGATRSRVRSWLAARASETAFPGITGPIAFHPTGDVVGKGFVMTRVRRGTLERAGGGG